MKGIILAGGSGTRLYPLTKSISKQILPVYDKPMIYYPLSIMMLGGIKEIAIISTPRDLPQFRSLLGDGDNLGIELSYFEQKEPKGIADAFLVCENFISDNSVSLILGDNIFYGNMKLEDIFSKFKEGAAVFGYPVKDPERYGVIEFDDMGKVKAFHEKPRVPPSNFAVPGLYIYDKHVVEFAKNLAPSSRGELEITDLNNMYSKKGMMQVQILGRGVAWLDVGKVQNLQEAGDFIMAIEKRQSFKISCIEEIAFRKGFINYKEYSSLIDAIPDSEYKDYLLSLKPEFEVFDKESEDKIRKMQI